MHWPWSLRYFFEKYFYYLTANLRCQLTLYSIYFIEIKFFLISILESIHAVYRAFKSYLSFDLLLTKIL